MSPKAPTYTQIEVLSVKDGLTIDLSFSLFGLRTKENITKENIILQVSKKDFKKMLSM